MRRGRRSFHRAYGLRPPERQHPTPRHGPSLRGRGGHQAAQGLQHGPPHADGVARPPRATAPFAVQTVSPGRRGWNLLPRRPVYRFSL